MAIQASQFIGSKISLITKAEIRYEGILYALDLQEATISLAKVKSFGTEDRPTPQPTPPKDEIFEFIIFRGGDIKSLDVVEPPKSVTALTSGVPPNDPAIVEVSYYHTASGLRGNAAEAKLTQANNAGVLNTLLSGQSPTKSGGGNRRRRKSANANDAGTQAGQRRGRGSRNKNNSSSNNGNQSDTSQNAASSNNGNSGQRQNGRGRGRGRPSRQNSADTSTFFAQMQQAAPHGYFQPPPFMMRPPGGFRGGFRGGRGRSFVRRNQQPQGIIEAQQPAKVTFEEPFDFEKSHEELVQTLAKLEVVDKEKAAAAEAAMQNGEGAPGGIGNFEGEKENREAAADIVYYCKENFFDKISCEALKQPHPGRNVRIDRRAEQKLNTETFGASAARGGPRRGGGGSYNYYNNRSGYYRSNHNPYMAMMAAGGYDPTPYFMPGNGGFGNYRRGGGGRGGGGGGNGRGFYRGGSGFYDNF